MSSALHPPAPQPQRTLHLKGGRKGVLLFHGLSSSPLELQFIARGLNRAGFTVKVPVLDGYTYGTFGSSVTTTAHSWVASALKELDHMLAECESVAIGGLCLGSALALRVAGLRSDRLSTLLCLSTALDYDGWGNPWYTHLLPLARYVPFAKRISIKEREPFGLKDIRMRAWVARQMREAGESDAGAATLSVAELLKARDLIAMARNSLTEVTVPTLLIHAKEDECATPRSSYEIAGRINASRIRVTLLADSYHMISIDREKEHVLSEMLQFLSVSDERNLAVSSKERVKVLSLFANRKDTEK